MKSSHPPKSPVRPGYLLPLAVPAILSALFTLALPRGLEMLAFNRSAVVAGQVWRLISGHLAHCDLEHLAWNLAGLLVLGLIFRPSLSARMLPALLAGALAVDAWLWWGSGLERYCGLSGALNGLLAAGLLSWWRRDRSLLIPAVAALCLAKIALEASLGTALFTDTPWPSAPMAHAAGFAGGLAVEAWAGSNRNVLKTLKPGRRLKRPGPAAGLDIPG